VNSGDPLADEVIAIQRLLGSSFAENATLRTEIERLHVQVDARELVKLAQGIIMGRLEISADLALELLTRGAGPEDAKLALIAAAVVASKHTPAEIAAEVLRDAADDRLGGDAL
jgi:AmiR/NasT family two-component response regulator